MAPNIYKNFDLVIDRAADGYQARVFEGPAGQAATTFQLPASIAGQHNQLALVGGAMVSPAFRLGK